MREWAYAHAYRNSQQRKAELTFWLHRYNWHRPHAGIDDKVPISRLGLPENNLLRLHSKPVIGSGALYGYAKSQDGANNPVNEGHGPHGQHRRCAW